MPHGKCLFSMSSKITEKCYDFKTLLDFGKLRKKFDRIHTYLRYIAIFNMKIFSWRNLVPTNKEFNLLSPTCQFPDNQKMYLR